MAPQASAVPSCGGNNNVVVSPYTCTKQRVIDGTTFTVVLDVTNDVVTAHYTLNAPRAADTPIRVRSHRGISSVGDHPTEVSGVIPAGATSAVLSVALSCGQIDVKAVFTGNGDASGRVTAPYITDSNDCAAATTTTTTPTTGPGTTTPASTSTTAPGEATSIVTTPGSSTTIPGPLPATGGGVGFALGGVSLFVIGLVLLTIGRRRTDWMG